MRDIKEKCDPVRQGREDRRDQKERGLDIDILIFLFLKKTKKTMVKVLVNQSSPHLTLCDPMDYSLPDAFTLKPEMEVYMIN